MSPDHCLKIRKPKRVSKAISAKSGIVGVNETPRDNNFVWRIVSGPRPASVFRAVQNLDFIMTQVVLFYFIVL